MEKAPDIELLNARSERVLLSTFWKTGPVLFVFYPGDFTPTCTAQLCEYRDRYADFKDLGVSIVGISPDSPDKHVAFQAEKQFPFPLLSDPQKEAVRAFKCTSKWTLGFANRALCLVNTQGEIVWRYVEAIAVTRRRASELREVIERAKADGLI